MVEYKRNQRKNTVLPAILSGITSVGLLYPPAFKPVRYSGTYNHDMKIIGLDMLQAEKKYIHDTKEESR